MNQAELAEKIDASESTVSRLLSGERRPSLDLIFRIRDVLGWSADDQVLCLEAYEGNTYGAKLQLHMFEEDVDGVG